MTDPEAAAARVDVLLASARDELGWRAEPADLEAIRRDGGLVIDTRPIEKRERDGELPHALVVDRNVLEWRLDPTSPHRIPQMRGSDQVVVVVCDEGYASTLAATTLRRLGLHRATDLAGGYQEWSRWASGSVCTGGDAS
jgi:rhodanese-related sulfurtransferase